MRHIAVASFVALFLVACGGKDGSNPNCTPTGDQCADGADGCCTGFCEELTGACARQPGVCLAAGQDCSVGPDCCSLACVDFKCSGDACVSDNQACDSDGECCSGACNSGQCAPLNPSCKTAGNTCSTHAECCSELCDDPDSDGTKTCNISPSFCTQNGDVCVNDGECCGGTCMKSGSATVGICEKVPAGGATGCAVLGEVCDMGASYDPSQALPTCGGECCSRACFPYGPTGVLICQPPSGCRPTGELCYTDSDCCGGPGQPDNNLSNVMCSKEPGYAVGRCDNGNSCSPAGAICRLQSVECNANANCCAGNVLQFDTCHQDSLGIPRCGVGVGVDCTDPASHAGQTCASSADCCGLPCVGNPETGFVCGSTCVAQGGACTTTADCCSGLPCTIPEGSTTGVCGAPQGCADYGQACTMSSDCCNMLPCTDGKCQGIIL
jgi:hypothetical protein